LKYLDENDRYDVIFVEDLPKTISGKIMRVELRNKEKEVYKA
jgi:acyl-coenzyme A synthetase/AMP-(fatty) acid ligase